MIPGALATAEDYTAFATALGVQHTVHVLQRRGRGGSAPQDPSYSIEQEREDAASLLTLTGSEILIGHSFGGLVALETARDNPQVRSLALYEPGLSINGSVPMSWIEPARTLLERGCAMEAFVSYVAATGPVASRFVPAWALKRLLRRMLPQDELERMLMLMPENIAEHEQIARLGHQTGRYAGLPARTLLLSGGSTGISYLKRATEALRRELPRSENRVLKGLNHFAIMNRGAPQAVAQAVSDFLARG